MESSPSNLNLNTSSEARAAATAIVRELRAAGHVAYFAGGCVRDALLGRTPKDYDVATDARPERVREIFRYSKYVGEAFGVVLVRLMNEEIEVATFRSEWGYEDGRRPTKVEFTDAKNDACRRDFTINGMFEDPLPSPGSDPVIDYVGGRDDLRDKKIRAIGDPGDRFAEDYLRMLRAVRFAARLGFEIEDKTARAIRNQARYLGQISRERIGIEIQMMLSHPTRASAPRLLQSLHLDGPSLNGEHMTVDVPTLVDLPPSAAYEVALAAWMLDRHFAIEPVTPERGPGGRTKIDPAEVAARQLDEFVSRKAESLIKRWRAALCLSNDQRADLSGTLQLASRLLFWPGLKIAGRKRLLAMPLASKAVELLHALSHLEGVKTIVTAIDADSPSLISDGVSPVAFIFGEDLIAAGLKPGPHFKALLDDAYDAQLEHRVDSREEALAWLKERVKQ